MFVLDYCGVSVFLNKHSSFVYARVGSALMALLDGSPMRFAFVYDDDILSRFPNLTQEDLFNCICAIKRKYNIS